MDAEQPPGPDPGDSRNTTWRLGLRKSFEEAERKIIDLKKIDRRTRR